ncbi:hypothetical protein KFK09_007236 [Dendrobium nobile]|uniref:Uncharacterized protein n=1 Tax=Dendrobium nobile TaxID=94219 RepID=A0A8T3BRD1_DENNO|nr:hypothetical protein KFK09_007236 [Dendrobium nobile]
MACSNLIIEAPLSSESVEIESGTSKNISGDPKNVEIGPFGTKIGPKNGLGGRSGRTGRPATAAAAGTAGRHLDTRAARLGRPTRLRPAWAAPAARLGRACGPRCSPRGGLLGRATARAAARAAARVAARLGRLSPHGQPVWKVPTASFERTDGSVWPTDLVGPTCAKN